eukprot:EG_transcript_3823
MSGPAGPYGPPYTTFAMPSPVSGSWPPGSLPAAVAGAGYAAPYPPAPAPSNLSVLVPMVPPYALPYSLPSASAGFGSYPEDEDLSESSSEDDEPAPMFHHPYQAPGAGAKPVSRPYGATESPTHSLGMSGLSSRMAGPQDPLVGDDDPDLLAIDKTGIAVSANRLIAAHYGVGGRLDVDLVQLARQVRDGADHEPSADRAVQVTASVLELWRNRMDLRTAATLSRHSGSDGGSPQRHGTEFAHRITKLMLGSPAHAAGLIPFFDHIVALDDITLGPELEWFLKYCKDRIGKVIKVDVYNSRTHMHRVCNVSPSASWDTVGGRGLLGCTLRWVDVNLGHLAARRVFQVRPRSNAYVAGITPGHDWIVGIQYGPPSAMSACAFSAPDDYDFVIQQLTRQPGQYRLVIVMVYDMSDNTVREILCRTPLGITVYGPRQCTIPVGTEVPRLAFVTNNRILDEPSSGSAEDPTQEPLGDGKSSVLEPEHDPFLDQKYVPQLPELSFCQRLCNGRMRAVWTAAACSFLGCVAGGVFLICVFIVSVTEHCGQPLAAWALVAGISALFVAPAVWVLGVLCRRVPPAASRWMQFTVYCSFLAILLLLFLLSWFVIGNVWTYDTSSPDDCDAFLWWSNVAALIVCYATLALAACCLGCSGLKRVCRGRLQLRRRLRRLTGCPDGCRCRCRCPDCRWPRWLRWPRWPRGLRRRYAPSPHPPPPGPPQEVMSEADDAAGLDSRL